MNEPEELSPEPTSFAEWAEDARRRARKKQIAESDPDGEPLVTPELQQADPDAWKPLAGGNS